MAFLGKYKRGAASGAASPVGPGQDQIWSDYARHARLAEDLLLPSAGEADVARAQVHATLALVAATLLWDVP